MSKRDYSWTCIHCGVEYLFLESYMYWTDDKVKDFITTHLQLCPEDNNMSKIELEGCLDRLEPGKYYLLRNTFPHHDCYYDHGYSIEKVYEVEEENDTDIALFLLNQGAAESCLCGGITKDEKLGLEYSINDKEKVCFFEIRSIAELKIAIQISYPLLNGIFDQINI